MEENYFHAVVEAYKGLAERIRELIGYTGDGMALMKQAFERPSPQQGGYPDLAFNSLTTVTEQNEHDGSLDFLNGCTRFFRNPMSHTPKVNWHRNVEDAVDCLTLAAFYISFLTTAIRPPHHNDSRAWRARAWLFLVPVLRRRPRWWAWPE